MFHSVKYGLAEYRLNGWISSHKSSAELEARLLQHALNVDYVTAATYVEQLSQEGKVALEYDPETVLKPWLVDPRESDEELTGLY